mgnify:CR=1 FL=1
MTASELVKLYGRTVAALRHRRNAGLVQAASAKEEMDV